jgi:hypothetical protein
MMSTRLWAALPVGLVGWALALSSPGLYGQGKNEKKEPEKNDFFLFKGPGGFGGPPGGETRKLVEKFDKDGDGRLNKEERQAARESLKKERPGGFGPRGPGGKGPVGFPMPMAGPPQPGQVLPPPVRDMLELTDAQQKQIDELQKEIDAKVAKLLTAEQKKLLAEPFGFRMGGPGPGPGGFGPGGRGREPAKPGPKVAPGEVTHHPKAPLYDPGVLRTIFLDFEDKDWEAELADFKNTDVEVPATLTVDGKKYPTVGVHFRGMSSFQAVQPGHKRSLGLSMDFADKKQRLYGYKTLNLLNSNDDPSFLHTVLYSHIARQYIPAPKANLVKVVINGESWGVYVNVQQFNKEFTREFFHSDKGARWKARGGPGGGGGLEYVGENLADYKRRFEIKTRDSEKSWRALVRLCKVLNQTPPAKLEEALKPILDLDGALWFLALDVALVNNDGYWARASDYSLYLDEKGRFHVLPHDMNETFSPQPMMMGFGPGGPGGPPGGPGGMGGRGGDLDPLVGLNDARKPLRSKLLAVPALRDRYLRCVREIAEKQLDWARLGPVVAGYRKLIEKEVEADTRKLYPVAAFLSATADKATGDQPRGRESSLRAFAEKRRDYLLKYEAKKKKGE